MTPSTPNIYGKSEIWKKAKKQKLAATEIPIYQTVKVLEMKQRQCGLGKRYGKGTLTKTTIGFDHIKRPKNRWARKVLEWVPSK